MSNPPIPHERLTELRRRASSRLTGQGADAEPFAASDALAVLHDLAASPETAADALALLHELQVHQVELELQAEEMRESRAELEAQLQRQLALYDDQPVGCFSVDGELTLHELNRQGCRLLGLSRDEALGLRLDAFLRDDSARELRGLIAALAPGATGPAATLRLLSQQGADRRVGAHVGADADGRRFLLVLTPVD